MLLYPMSYFFVCRVRDFHPRRTLALASCTHVTWTIIHPRDTNIIRHLYQIVDVFVIDFFFSHAFLIMCFIYVRE